MKKIYKLIILLFLFQMAFAKAIVVHGALYEATQSTASDTAETMPSSDEPEVEKSEESQEVSSSSEDETSESTVEEPSETTETIESEVETTESSSDVSENSQTYTVTAQAAEQADDGYWLVDTVETLNTYLAEGKNLLRLKNDLDLGTAGFKLYTDFVLDGDGHKLTYNKGSGYRTGFYIEENNAEVTMKNINFGNSDGSGTIGYYGIVTGNSSYSNTTIIYENISYISSNGQPLYNPNGKVILRGNNNFSQSGTSTYSQEWAEVNYIEIQSGKTTVDHQNTNGDGLIYTTNGTAAGNTERNTSQVIVRTGATFDVTTDKVFFYSAASFQHVIKVEKQGSLLVNKLSGSNTVRDRFIYPNLGTSATLNLDFEGGSSVQMNLSTSIQVKSAQGGLTVGKDAAVEIGVQSGTVFDVTSNSSRLFKLSMDDPQLVDLKGATAGTLGLQASASTVNNLSLLGSSRIKVTSYDDSEGANELGTFGKTATQLNVRGSVYTNLSGDSLSAEELGYLSKSKRLVFRKGEVPLILDSEVNDITAETATLSVLADGRGSEVKEVKYLLFTSEEDIGTLEKAKHIENVTDFNGADTSSVYQYNHEIEGLNPNTSYWLQTMVTNNAGSSSYSEPVHFYTKPKLKMMTVEIVEEKEVILSGELSSDTGFWMNYQNGEADPLPNQKADYGGNYQRVVVEYSTDPTFTKYQSKVASSFGTKVELLLVQLTDLSPNTTYYARLRATGAGGDEAVLTDKPVTQFTTNPGEEDIIDVEVPIEMAFETKNSDLATVDAGKIYSKQDDYQVINHGNVPTSISVTGMDAQNEAAENLLLLSGENGQLGKDELALKLLATGQTTTETFLTKNLAQNPVKLGSLNTTDNQTMQLDFSGKYFNPLSRELLPSYQLTLKFEKE